MTTEPIFLIDVNVKDGDNHHLQNLVNSNLCEYVGHVLYAEASDFEIGMYLAEHDRTLITNDKKFALSLLLSNKKVGYIRNKNGFDSIDFLYPSIKVKFQELYNPKILKMLTGREI